MFFFFFFKVSMQLSHDVTAMLIAHSRDVYILQVLEFSLLQHVDHLQACAELAVGEIYLI